MTNIVISAGHYPERPGANYMGFYEHWEALSWVDRVYQSIEEMSPGCCRIAYGSLPKKISFINSLNVDLAIDFHFNAAPFSNKVNGCETLYFPGSAKGKISATKFQKEIVDVMKNTDRGAKEGWYKMDRPGIIDFYGDKEGDETPAYFLRKTNCTALILEPEFINNIKNIQSKRNDCCEVIADCILDYLYL